MGESQGHMSQTALAFDAFASRASKGEGEKPVDDATVVLLAGRGASFAVGRMGVEINRARDIVDEAVREVLADYHLTAPARATGQEPPAVGASETPRGAGVVGGSSPAPSPGACPTCGTQVPANEYWGFLAGQYSPRVYFPQSIMDDNPEIVHRFTKCPDPFHHPAQSSSGVPREVEEAIQAALDNVAVIEDRTTARERVAALSCERANVEALRAAITRALAEARRDERERAATRCGELQLLYEQIASEKRNAGRDDTYESGVAHGTACCRDSIRALPTPGATDAGAK